MKIKNIIRNFNFNKLIFIKFRTMLQIQINRSFKLMLTTPLKINFKHKLKNDFLFILFYFDSFIKDLKFSFEIFHKY